MKNRIVGAARWLCLLGLAGLFPVLNGLFPGFTGSISEAEPRAATFVSSLLVIQGSGAGLNNGDYVSDSNGLNSQHRYFIEVPPGLARLSVDIFDADIGLGGSSEATAGRDRSRAASFNSSVSYQLYDPSGRRHSTNFAVGNQTSPVGSDNAWINFYDSTGDTVRDNFGTAAYNNSDGTTSWSSDWIESNDDGSAATGLISVTGGELRIRDDGTGASSKIERQADLSGGFSSATLSFDCRSQNVEVTDQVLLEVSSNGGASWTTLATFNGSIASGNRSYDISSYLSANTRIRFNTVSGYSGTDTFYVDNVQIKTNGIAPGHWEVRIDMSAAVTTGSDVNAFGLRAHDGTSGNGGTELNIYADSIVGIGVNPGLSSSSANSRSYHFYPYITSGCSCGLNDFDFDSNNSNVGSATLTTPSGQISQTFSSARLSSDNNWIRNTVTQWNRDDKSDGYGIWEMLATINSYQNFNGQNGNYANVYLTNSQAVSNPPTSNPAQNTFRTYLPTDIGSAPVKPYLEQDMVHWGGPNPPAVGQTVREKIVVRLVNPTPWPIKFSAANVVTANVPGGGAVYAGNAMVGQGTIVSQPAVGGTGNIIWNPGVVAAGLTTVLIYDVLATPTAAGQRIPLTGSVASGNGTRARFVDETGNTDQARATYTLGPLCELAIMVNRLTSEMNCYFALITPSTLPDATAGVPYSQGVSPGSLQLIDGSLPNNLTYSGGTISGTPTGTGTYRFILATPLNPGISPAGCASAHTFTLTVNNPTAADVNLTGRVTDVDGRGVMNARVEITDTFGNKRYATTNPFGYYLLADIEAGSSYVVEVHHKNLTFTPRMITATDSMDNMDFVGRRR